MLQAIKLNGTVLGLYPLRVMQSKTAIVPVNTEFLPRTQARAGLVAAWVWPLSGGVHRHGCHSWDKPGMGTNGDAGGAGAVCTHCLCRQH